MHQCTALQHHYSLVRIKFISSRTSAIVIHPSNIVRKATTGQTEDVDAIPRILSVRVKRCERHTMTLTLFIWADYQENSCLRRYESLFL
jgi:hypothetical protein